MPKPPTQMPQPRSKFVPGPTSTRIALLGACAVAAILWGTAGAWAAEVQLTNTGETSLTYSDNINLEPDGEEDSAIVWTNTGATRVRATGARAQAALDAALSLDTIVGSGDTDLNLRPNARGLGTVELLEDHFFIDGRAAALVALSSPFSAVSASPSSGRRNQDKVYLIGASPYYVQHFGNWATSEARYRHDRVYVQGDGEDVSDSVTNAASLHTATGSRFTRIRLRNDLEYENVNSSDSQGDLERETALVGAQYAFSRQFSALGSIGYEKIDSGDIIDDPEGLIWNAGAIIEPGPRTQLKFTYGERYDNPNWFASARYDISSRLTFRASYTQTIDVSTSRIGRESFDTAVDEQGRLIDTRTGLPVQDTQDPFGLADETFLSDRLLAALSGSFGRNNFVLLATSEKRKFDFRPDERLFTTSGEINHALTPETLVGLFAAYRKADQEAPGRADNDTVLARLQLVQSLAPNFQALASYSYSQRFANFNSDEYKENAVTLGLRVTF